MSPAPDPQLPAEAPRPQARCWPCPGAPCRLRLTLGRRPSQLALPVHGARSRRPAAACLLSRSSFGIKGDREEIRSQPRGSGSPPQILLGQGPGCAGGPGPRAGSARVLPEIRSHGLVLPGWPHGDIACSAPTARAARDPQAPARPRPPIRRARPGAGPELRGAREREAGAASLLRDGGHRGGGTVERNRLLLQETLNASGLRPLQAGAAAWTLSRGRAAPERPAGDEDGDPGFSLQDSDKNGAFGLRLEPALSPWHEEAKRVLQGTRMKARTQPLRASHDIVLTNAQGSRDGQGSPTLEPRTTSSCSHSLSHASVPRPRWGPFAAHVRFEDESACEAEFRYLERLQERQRQVLSTVLQAMDQGALRSKPDLTDYIAGGLRLQDARSVGSRRKCSAWGSYAGHPCPAEGKALPNRGVPQELHADSQWGLSTPLFLSAEPGFHGGWIRETHIGSIPDPEGEDPALDSCQLRKEEVGTLWPSSTCERHHGGLEGPGRAEVELPLGFQARPHLSGAADMDVGQEEGGGGCLPEGTSFLREDAVPEPALASEGASLGSHRQPGPGLGSHQAHSAASRAPWRTGCESSSQAQTNHNSLEIVPCLSPPQSCTEPCAPHHALRPAPPSSRRTPTPPSRRRTVPAVHLPPAPSRREAVRTCEPSPPPQAQPCSPLGQYPLLAPAPNNCGSGPSGGPQEPCEGRLEERPCGWEPEPAPDSDGHADVATVHATGITISLASEPESSQEPEGALQTTRLHSTGCVLPQASPEASAAPDPASATASSRSRKRGSSLVSSLGLRKFFSTLGQSARPKLATSRSRSVEQLHPAVPATAPHSSTPGARRAPSLQALHLGSPWHQHHGAASFHSLHALLSGKGDRSSLYLVAEPGGHGVAGSQGPAPACPQRGGRGHPQPGSHRGPRGGGVPGRHEPATAAALPGRHFRLLCGLWEWAPGLRVLRAGDG
nr:uncharacterized protein KIAA1614 homolog isoform X3 [Oryctolagus cuniculus]